MLFRQKLFQSLLLLGARLEYQHQTFERLSGIQSCANPRARHLGMRRTFHLNEFTRANATRKPRRYAVGTLAHQLHCG